MLFKIKVWEKHRKVIFSDDEKDFILVPHETDEEWRKFNYAIEVDRVRIETVEEFVIFDSDNTAQACVIIYFSDGAFCYGRYPSIESFEKVYNEKYIPIVPKSLSDIVEALESEPPEG